MIFRYYFLSVLLVFIASSLLLAQDGDGLGFFVKAEQLRQANQYRAAIDQYNNAIKDNPRNYKFVFQKGKCYINLRNEDNAISAFERAVELKRDYVPAYARLAWLYQRKERFKEAIDALDKAFRYETNPVEKIEYKSSIIRILYRLGRFKQAGRHIADALNVNPGDPTILFYDANYKNLTGNHLAAKKSALKAISLTSSKNPKNFARHYYELGYAHYELGEFTKAFEAFRNADYGPFQSKIAEKTPQYKVELAKCYFLAFENKKCEKIVNFCLKMKQNFSPAHMLKLKLAERQTDKALIIDHTLNLIKSEAIPERKALHYAELAELYINQKRYDDAVETANKALILQPTNYRVAYFKIVAFAKKKLYGAAIAELNTLLKYKGLDFDTKALFNFTLGLIQKRKGDTSAATQAFNVCTYGPFKYAAKEELKSIGQIK